MKLIEIWIWLNEWFLWILLGIFILQFIISLYDFNRFLKSRPNKRIVKDLFKNERFEDGDDEMVIKWWMKVLMLIGAYITFLLVQKWFRKRIERNDSDNSPDDVNK